MVRADPMADLELEARRVAEDLRAGRLAFEPETEQEDLWQLQIEELARRRPGYFDEDYEAALRSTLGERSDPVPDPRSAVPSLS